MSHLEFIKIYKKEVILFYSFQIGYNIGTQANRTNAVPSIIVLALEKTTELWFSISKYCACRGSYLPGKSQFFN